MKRSYISIIVLVIALSVSAQAPLSFKYQAYLRNADGTIRGNEFVTLQMRIVQGTINGAAVYTEVHNTSTNGHGLVSVNVGDGSTSSNMSAVDWSLGPFFLDISINGIHLGTTELLAVPFALYANETGDSFSGDYDDLTGTPNLARVATTGNYSDLTNTPHLSTVAITGSYTSLLNIPSTFIPAVHTHIESEISDLAHYTDDSISGAETVFDSWDKDTADDFSGSYLDLTDAPAISDHYTDDSIDGTEAAFIGWDMDVSDDFVGDMGGGMITNLTMPIAPGAPTDGVNRAYVDAVVGFSGSFNDLTDVPITLDRDSTNNLPVSYGDLIDVPVNMDTDATDDFAGDMGGSRITNLGTPILPTDAATRAYVDASSGSFSGSYNDLSDVPTNIDEDATDDFSGNYSDLIGVPVNMDTDATDDFAGDMGGAPITNLGAPTAATDAATRAYVDALEARVAVLEGLVGTLITDLDALEAAVVALTARVTAHETAYP